MHVWTNFKLLLSWHCYSFWICYLTTNNNSSSRQREGRWPDKVSAFLCVFFFNFFIVCENFTYFWQIFSLFLLQTDLCGIKWRKLVQVERPNASSDPLDDPVLRSYSKCLAVDILCVWRRVAAPKPDPDPAGFLELSLQQPTSVTHPPLSLTAAKELWIFWYGEEPDLTELVAPELLKSSGKSHFFTNLNQ